jgi:CBS domain containing-hemolysin-like protein
VYHKSPNNIVGILNVRSLIRAQDHKNVREFTEPPWFITENLSAITLLQQFRHNQETAAVVVNNRGQAIGMIQLDDLVDEIFGTEEVMQTKLQSRIIFERTYSAEMTVGEFQETFGVTLDPDSDLTLSELLTYHLGRHPEEGESLFLQDIEIVAKECGLLDVKRVIIKTRG